MKNKDTEEADSDKDDDNEDSADNDDQKMVEKDKKSANKSKLLSLHLIFSKIEWFLGRFHSFPCENWSFAGSFQTVWTNIRH